MLVMSAININKELSNKKEKFLSLFLIAFIITSLDQVTKHIVLTMIPLNTHIEVIPNILNITHIHNPGGAFGLIAHGSPGIKYFLFIALPFMILTLIVYFYKNIPNPYNPLHYGLSLIIGGGIGNIIDRLRFGKVIDFIDLFVNQYHWPAFNVADTSITLGSIIFISCIAINKAPHQDE